MTQAESPSARIVAEYRRRIEAGQLRPGDRVPSTRQLTRDWGVAIATATKALSALRDAGLVRAIPGVGTVVADPAAPDHGADLAERGDRAADRAAQRADRATQRAEQATQRGVRRLDRDRPDDEPELSRDRIVRTAVAIADAEGMAAVSMRRVAADLGAATMSLYRHVPGKDELTYLMTDEVMRRYPLPEPPPPGWRAQLELVAHLHWRIYRAHPWVAALMSFTRPAPIQHGMAHTEWSMRALDGLGLDPGTRLHLVVTMFGFIHGIGVNLEAEVEEEHNTGLTSDEWMKTQDLTLTTIASGRFPLLLAVAQQEDFDLPLDALFATGLKLMLDGMAHLLADPAAVQRLVRFANTVSASAVSARVTAASPDPLR